VEEEEMEECIRMSRKGGRMLVVLENANARGFAGLFRVETSTSAGALPLCRKGDITMVFRQMVI